MAKELLFLAAGLLAGLLLYKGCRTLTGMPSADSAEGQSRRRISIIIPARNEEHNLPRLLESLRRQSMQPFEIVVVDDGSEDKTAEVALSGGASVVSPGELPPGWSGKSWACWNGAKTASGDWLAFVDADAWFEEDGLRRLLEESEGMKPAGVITIQPYHKVYEPYESLSAFFNAVVALSIGHGSADSAWRKQGYGPHAGGYGPCLALSRETYERIGGHQRVGGEVLEHHALCRKTASLGLPVRNRLGRGILSFRMYPDGVQSLLSGWAKSLASGAASTAVLRLCGVSLWIAGAASSAALLATGILGSTSVDISVAIAGYLLQAALLYAMLRKLGSFGWAAALLYPFSLAVFILVFGYSLFRTFALKSVSWKGRAVPTGGGEGP
jgi:4,4'-diaponeurosporenoate glycosyltransferase